MDLCFVHFAFVRTPVLPDILTRYQRGEGLASTINKQPIEGRVKGLATLQAMHIAYN